MGHDPEALRRPPGGSDEALGGAGDLVVGLVDPARKRPASGFLVELERQRRRGRYVAILYAIDLMIDPLPAVRSERPCLASGRTVLEQVMTDAERKVVLLQAEVLRFQLAWQLRR